MRWLRLLLVIVFLMTSSGEIYAEPSLDQIVDTQLDYLQTEELQKTIEQLDEEVRQLIPSVNIKDLITGKGIDFSEVAKVLFQSLFREFFLNSRLLGQLIILAVLCSLLQNIQVFNGAKGSVDLAFAVCFLVLTYIGLQSFREVVAIGSRSIDQMVSLMYALLPVLSASMAATGAIGSVTLLHPLLVAVVGLVAFVVSKIVFPLLFCGAVLSIVGNFSKEFPVSKLSGLFNQATVVFLTLGFIVFLGVLAVKGSIAPVADGVTIRTAKYLTGTFIPVIGKMFADSLEVVVGGSLLIKNAVGTLGMLVIVILVAFPLIKIASILVIYKLVTALIQPISDARLVSALSGMGNSIAMVFAAVGTVAVMFFVAITILVGVGNIAVMIR